jgi:1,4-alpha-glucan branching enzyme
MAIVQFTYLTGLERSIFSNVRLTGSWDETGRYAQNWTTVAMQPKTGEDGCPCFTATVTLDDTQVDREFRWGVIFDTPSGRNLWGIVTEEHSTDSTARDRRFILQNSAGLPQLETYYLTHVRRLGAQKYYPNGIANPGVQFSVWAPNARNVEVVFGNSNGYIADDGDGIDSTRPPLTMSRQPDGVWQTNDASSLADFRAYQRLPYMFRVTKDDGNVFYKTDLYSRCQMGRGQTRPAPGAHYAGSYTELDGLVSCSVVIDPETVTSKLAADISPSPVFISAAEFWQTELNANRPLPRRVEDLVIYELHVGALGYGRSRPGNFEDAIALLPYLVDLGVNAVELLPMSEFSGSTNWGYETSHYFALEYSAGGRDQLKHFIRACHQQGIAVIMDVVYNHYSPNSGRAEWAYDSDLPERNMYYWYEGNPSNYPQPDGGYVDNLSTGYSPRFHEEIVRKMFISSAVTLMEEFHVDGFRMDQTTAMHLYNVLHADGRPLGNVNAFGAKFLRELTRTLKLVNPDIMLMAEDHSNWDRVTQAPDVGGLGFEATWYADFYHHLIGDTQTGTQYAKLIPTAGLGGNEPLAMDRFAGALANSGANKVVYHESHDEAGNSSSQVNGNRIESRRTILSAVNGAPLIGATRRYGEARARFAFGMSLLSAGTPMFMMGEEIGAQKQYRYRDFIDNREDLWGERQGEGQRLFRFYQDLIRLRLDRGGLRSHNISVIYVHNANRIIAFRRWQDAEEFLIVGSLNNTAFGAGYTIGSSQLNHDRWREVFNSDASIYGGDNVGNSGANISANNDRIQVVIPANGFVVFQQDIMV